MKSKFTHADFVNAARAKGVAPMLFGGPTPSLLPGVQPGPVPAPAAPDLTQGGLGGLLTNQNQFTAQLAPTQTSNYQNLMGGAGTQNAVAVGQYNNNIGQEQALAQQLQAEGMGQGPNPAQAALAQNTGANIAAQNALAAGQRGAGANVGLLERQAAQQGAAVQQQAVGQASTLAAQQQLAAQQTAAGVQGNIGTQAVNAQNAANNVLGTTIQGQNTQNANAITNQAQMQGINAQIAGQNAQSANQTTGGILGGISSILGLAGGGEVPQKMASGGNVAQIQIPTLSMPTINPWANFAQRVSQNQDGPLGPSSLAGKFLAATGITKDPTDSLPLLPDAPTSAGEAPGATSPTYAAKGGKIKPVSGEMLAAKGVAVPGKAKVKGDSLKNDNVPAMLSPGEIVIPRRITQGPDAANQAARFVAAIQAKQGLKR